MYILEFLKTASAFNNEMNVYQQETQKYYKIKIQPSLFVEVATLKTKDSHLPCDSVGFKEVTCVNGMLWVGFRCLGWREAAL